MRKRTQKKPRGNGWTTERGRRAAHARWANNQRPADAVLADEMQRAKIDRKGRIIRIIETIDADGTRLLLGIRYSLHGRTDQYDIYDPTTGMATYTGGHTAILRHLTRILLP
jgi:hypothetical protein